MVQIKHATAAGAGSGTGGTISSDEWDEDHEVVGFYPGASHFGGVVPGTYMRTSGNSAAGTSRTFAANDFCLAPHVPAVSHSIDQIGIRAGSGSGGDVKLVLYESGTDGWPQSLLFESAPMSVTAGNASYFATVSIDLVAGKLYWLGLRVSASRAVYAGSSFDILPIMSRTTDGDTSAASLMELAHTLTFATAATDPFPMVTSFGGGGSLPSMLSSFNKPPLFVLRAA